MTNKVRGSIIDLPQSASAPPVSGTYLVGALLYSNLSSGPVGWKCTVAGTPGTWKPFGEILLDLTQTWDPPSMLAGAKTDNVVTVSGAALGDFAVASMNLDITGCTLHAVVTAANTVTVTLVNVSGASINIGSGTLYVRVHKK